MGNPDEGVEMARMEFMASEEFALKLSKLESGSEEISKKAIYAGADIVADEIKKRLEGVIEDKSATGLIKSFGITPIKLGADGNWSCKVGFDGYDDKHIAFQLIARAMESGTSTRSPKPFVRPAVNAVRKQVVSKMDEVCNEEIQKLIR